MRQSFLLMRACVVALVLVFAMQASAATEEITARGRLGRTVEPGGWIINAPRERYLVINADRFKSESWFREGADVEAVGEVKKDVVTTYMEGMPFEARTMRPQGGVATGGGATSGSGLTRVVVTGDALVQSQPDTAIINVAVVTQNLSASEAQAENAAKSDAVVRAVKAAAGAGAEVKTSGYSLQPQYDYRDGAAPRITGYLARNSVLVTMGDLPKVGAVIDAATRAGANNIDSLAFTLRRDEQARGQALTGATHEAVLKARLIAEALGGRLVRVVEVQEAGAARPPVPVYDRAELSMARSSAVQTPIEIGSLDIRAQVQLVAEIETKP